MKLGPGKIALVIGCLALFLLLVTVGGSIGLGMWAINNLGGSTSSSSSGSGTATKGAAIPDNKSELPAGKNVKITIPSTRGKTGFEGATSSLAFDCDAEEKKWYMNMRWPYVKWAWNGDATGFDNTKHLYQGVRVVVYNPNTQKSVVAAICEAGPAPWTGSHMSKGNPPSYWPAGKYFRFDPPGYITSTGTVGRVSGLAAAPFDAIDAKIDDVLEYGFAVDQSIPLGPVK